MIGSALVCMSVWLQMFSTLALDFLATISQNVFDRSSPNIQDCWNVGGIDNANIHFAIAQGMLPWQQISEADLPSFVALSFRNGLEYQNANTRVILAQWIGLQKFGEIWCNNSRVCEARVYLPKRWIAEKWHTRSIISAIFWTDLHQIFWIGWYMDDDS